MTKKMNLKKLSSCYDVRTLTAQDIDTIYELSIKNPMFYQYCPPFVTKESILEDMKALPPKKTYDDKYYVGFWENETLVAIMDLIVRFPNEETAFVGFFMMNKEKQKKGIGSKIISECASYLKSLGYSYIRLGFAKGNPQSEAFWKKNGFVRTGVEAENDGYTVVILQRTLKMDRQRVYEYLQMIPQGKVVTYGMIAEYIGDRKFARAVGNILHANPDGEKYPCYKVVNAKGKLSESYAFGGKKAQKKRLEEEGIEVNGYAVDLNKYLITE